MGRIVKRKKIYKEIAETLEIDPEEVEKVITSQFLFLRSHISDVLKTGDLMHVRLPFFGAFKVHKKRYMDYLSKLSKVRKDLPTWENKEGATIPDWLSIEGTPGETITITHNGKSAKIKQGYIVVQEEDRLRLFSPNSYLRFIKPSINFRY